MREYIPKDLRNFGEPKKTRRQKDKRYEAKRRARLRAKAKEKEDWESLKKFADYQTPEEQFNSEVRWAKNRLALFIKRTNRFVDIGHLHYHMKRREQTVMRTLREEFPVHRASGWMVLKSGYGRRAGMNQDQLRRLCSRLQVPFWREMKTDEMRAVLILLVWKERLGRS